MNIIFNPLSNNALTESQLKNNDDIIFDLPGNNIFAKGVKFYGTDTHVEVLDSLDSDRTDAALSANMGRILDLNKVNGSRAEMLLVRFLVTNKSNL